MESAAATATTSATAGSARGGWAKDFGKHMLALPIGAAVECTFISVIAVFLPAPEHPPPLHLSLMVQAFPSLQALELLLNTQPLPGLQESLVQLFPSEHCSAAPPRQLPPAQVSPVVQAFPSLQDLELFAWAHPEFGSQESVVHLFPSLQFFAPPPTHVPPEQISATVHAFPSLHPELLGAFTHPTPGSQESLVQRFPSLQSGAVAPMQPPSIHESMSVQAFPSSQEATLGVCVQPTSGVQPSSVQGFPSSQSGAPCPTQTPASQVSMAEQEFPSSQDAVLSTKTHKTCSSHESSVHGLPSSHTIAVPAQTPSTQVSASVQFTPSSHAGPVAGNDTQPEMGSH